LFAFTSHASAFGAQSSQLQWADQKVEIESGRWRLKGDFRTNREPAPHPAVLLLNKAAGDRKAYARLADDLARVGISSLRLDLRGHGESTNAGVFVPGKAESLALIERTNEDVIAALDWLGRQRSVDAGRIGVVGASYSGEVAVLAARERARYARAYVLLSPGSFSEQSARAMDSSGARWLFIRAAREKAPSVRAAGELVKTVSRTTTIRVVDSDKHATDMLAASPELNRAIAQWLRKALMRSDLRKRTAS
jgi:dienelactone hydrolase